MSFRFITTTVLGIVLASVAACGGGSGAGAAQTPPAAQVPAQGETSLATEYQRLFPIGAAVRPDQISNPVTAALIAKQFNVLVAENAMKQESLSPKAQGQYDWAPADAIVDFATANKIKVRGHALVWHQQTAPWMFVRGSGPGGQVTREELIARLRSYIHDVVGHFKGRVYAWDVVNEAFVPDETGVDQEDGWRYSKWYEIIGPEYIELAFQFAHEADPDALLYYNDYGTESPRKRALIVALVKNLKAKGITIHGIGHQSHYTISYPQDWSGLEQTIIEVAAFGLSNQITELDISLNRDLMKAELTSIPASRLAEQAARYRSLFDMLVRQRGVVSAALVWGVSDADSWLLTWPVKRVDAPLLFDGQLKAKSAYQALVDAARAASDATSAPAGNGT